MPPCFSNIGRGRAQRPKALLQSRLSKIRGTPTAFRIPITKNIGYAAIPGVFTLFLLILGIEVLLFSSYCFSVPSEQSSEYVLVTGGPSLLEWERCRACPHDKYWGNFVRASRVRIQQLRDQYGPDFPITWVVYRRGYERRQRRQERNIICGIRSIQRKYNVELVWFYSGQQIIDYLNGNGVSTTSGSATQSKNRNLVKVNGFEYFGHANRACFMFDYSNEIDGTSKAYLHEDQLAKIRRGVFTRRAFIKSWGCYTGRSMSRKWRIATQHEMIGAVGPTDYTSGYAEGGVLPSTRKPWTR